MPSDTASFLEQCLCGMLFHSKLGRLNVTINSQLIREIAPSLGGNLDAAGNNITNLGTLTVQNVDGLVKGIDVGNIDSVVGFDLGGILPTAVSNLMQWFESLKPLDMGSTATPHATNVDLGSIA